MFWLLRKKKDIKETPTGLSYVEKHKNDFWDNPIFSNPVVKMEYKNTLLRVGHCPVCNDFLFVDINEECLYNGTVFYRVKKRCINHDCDYSKDISVEFNERLGIDVGFLKNNKVSDEKSDFLSELDRDCFGMRVPKSTGTLKSSFDGDNGYYSKLRREYVDHDCFGRKIDFSFHVECVPSLDDLRFVRGDGLFCVPNSIGGFDIYVRVDDGFELIDVLDINEYVDLKKAVSE